MNSKKRIILGIVGILFILGILFYTCYHSWSKATCEEAKTCTICGKTEGKPLGHTWSKATCEEPKECISCGKTEGKPLGHIWSKATCEKPKTCSICGRTEGEVLGHSVSDWKVVEEPTCSQAGKQEGICSRCQNTITESMNKVAHTLGEWEVKTEYIISPQAVVTPGEEVQKCKICQMELNSREYMIEMSTSQRNAVLKAYQEINSWHCGRDYLINEILVSYDGYSVEDATFAVDHMKVDWEQQAISYAKENGRGESKNRLAEMLEYYGFDQNQIAKAIESVGY